MARITSSGNDPKCPRSTREIVALELPAARARSSWRQPLRSRTVRTIEPTRRSSMVPMVTQGAALTLTWRTGGRARRRLPLRPRLGYAPPCPRPDSPALSPPDSPADHGPRPRAVSPPTRRPAWDCPPPRLRQMYPPRNVRRPIRPGRSQLGPVPRLLGTRATHDPGPIDPIEPRARNRFGPWVRLTFRWGGIWRSQWVGRPSNPKTERPFQPGPVKPRAQPRPGRGQPPLPRG